MKKFTIIARFSKRFIKGNLVGIVVHESLTFSSVSQAHAWQVAMDMASGLDYVIEDFYIEKPELSA